MTLYLFIQIGAFLSRIIPRSWRYVAGAVVGDCIYRLWPEKRRILRANMATVLGLSPLDPQVRRLAGQSMRNYAKYVVEWLELPSLSSKDEMISSMKIQGLEHLHSALERGKGVILASGHFGTIEVGGLRLADFTNFHAVHDTLKPARLDRWIQGIRQDKGINLVPVADVKAMLRVLRAGGTLAMLFDRPLRGGEGVPVRFFARRTQVPSGPAILALKTDATILPVYMFRNPDRTFECRIFPALAWTPSGNKELDVQAIMQRLTDTLQSVISSRPDQWYMFRRMWPEDHDEIPSGLLGAAAGSSAV
jgi:phosphatidylinositol dimannoside acyltransferase